MVESTVFLWMKLQLLLQNESQVLVDRQTFWAGCFARMILPLLLVFVFSLASLYLQIRQPLRISSSIASMFYACKVSSVSSATLGECDCNRRFSLTVNFHDKQTLFQTTAFGCRKPQILVYLSLGSLRSLYRYGGSKRKSVINFLRTQYLHLVSNTYPQCMSRVDVYASMEWSRSCACLTTILEWDSTPPTFGAYHSLNSLVDAICIKNKNLRLYFVGSDYTN